MKKIKYNIKAVARNLKSFRTNSTFKAKFMFTRYYDECEIKENEILIQCYGGTGMSCSPYYLLKEICENPEFKELDVYVVANEKNENQIRNYMQHMGYKNVQVVTLHSREYCRKLAEVKYLINNVTFPTYYIKKEGQVYLNTWHGTPLKALGKAMTEEMHLIGNVQRNFLMCDYLLAPNRFTLDVLRNDYMLNNLYGGKYVLCGYPRNHIFYDLEQQKKIRKELELEGKKVVVYMPTWRGGHAVRKDKDQYIYIMHMLIELDKNVDKDTIIYIKEHNMSTFKVDFKDFENVRSFPENMETYEFLSIADALITDYSSVMFDYANTGRKIILYAYDKEEYLKDRGMYMEFDELPFTLVDNSHDLIKEVKSLEHFEDYMDQMKDLIAYDSNNTIYSLLKVMQGCKNEETKLQLIDGEVYGNQKEKVLIFTGSLLRNGITTALKGVLNNLDKEERNYILTFGQRAVTPNKMVLRELGEFDYIGVMGQKNFRFLEALAYFMFFRLNIDNAFVEKKLKSIYSREIERIYPGIKFDYVIHYTGYERQYMNLYRFMDAERIVYVHSNLEEEHKNRGNIHIPTIKACYKEYDKIVTIREGQPLFMAEEKAEEKKYIAHNFNNYEYIIQNAELEVAFDENTESTCPAEELSHILDDPQSTVFINVARYSVEKGLDNLITAFERYYKEGNDKSYLVIVGGHGNQYEKIYTQREESEAKDHIILIKWMSNPYAILGRSDAFVLSSHYEGLPMVIMEALILNKPVISTAIQGPREFLEQGYGYLVDDSVDGLVQGFQEYKKNKLEFLKSFDYVGFNRNALEEFNALFE